MQLCLPRCADLALAGQAVVHVRIPVYDGYCITGLTTDRRVGMACGNP